MRNLPESLRHAPVNSVFRYTTASMRSATARESTRHTARSASAPGNGIKRSTTIRTHHPQRQTDPQGRRPHHTGDPAVGAGSRCPSCGPGGSWAEDDGSAVVGDGVGEAGGGSVGEGCGSTVRGVVGSALVGDGAPGLSGSPLPGSAPGEADARPFADGDADGDADSSAPFFPLPCPCLPSSAAAPIPAPPDTAAPPSGASPPRGPAECEGLALPRRRRRRRSCSRRQRRRP